MSSAHGVDTGDRQVKGQGTCLNDAAAQEAGVGSLLLQLSLHCAQLGKLGTCLALEGMLLCLHTPPTTYAPPQHVLRWVQMDSVLRNLAYSK